MNAPPHWRKLLLAAALLTPGSALASDVRGVVTFHGAPVPGATVTVTQNGKKTVTVTDTQGFYNLPALADGAATISIQMTGFAPLEEPLTIASDAPLGKLELKLLTLAEIQATLKPTPGPPINVAETTSQPVKTAEAPKPKAGQPAPSAPPEETASRAADGLLINGSVNNAATSQFSLAPRFGNTASGKSLYNISLNMRLDNSAFDARSYSLAGINTPKPLTNQLTGGFAIEGPLKIPHLLRNGPNIFVGYQRTENSISTSTPGLVPTAAERAGNLAPQSGSTGPVIYAPTTGLSAACLATPGVTPGQPFANSVIPTACISQQAQDLLNLYPLPNFTGNSQYNYQVPLITDTHQDALNSNASKTIGRKNQLYGVFAVASTRTSYSNIFGFTDQTHTLGLNTNVTWSHTYNAHWRSSATYTYSRFSNRTTPFFQSRTFAGEPLITGNDPDPLFAGPPSLNFTGGITGLYDSNASFDRNATNGIGGTIRWNRSPHNITAGADFRRQQFNYISQQDPRGTFSFTGAATGNANAVGSGSDLADFLLGVPDSSALAFGNRDKYLRQTVFDLYATDDWRINPQLTANIGVRYEYGAPVTEIKNRLVNLDVAGNFAAIAPVLASAPQGALTGRNFNRALVNPDRAAIEPRLGVSWRPFPGSSLIVSAGYGLNYDTSVYQGIALRMAQQAPLSKSVTLQNAPNCSLTLANGFRTDCAITTPQTFGIDPSFRVGYLHTWNLKLQRDLPFSLQAVVTYLGNKGTRGTQEFLPNTNAPGATNPCPSCPTGFEYLTSNGNSTREALLLQLRRRLRAGLTASVLYTYSKSIDDDSSLGGQGVATNGNATIAQDWRNLRGERGLSNFDQRHLVNMSLQYTTGQGKGGGTLLTGWRGRVYKEWTVQMQVNAGSGLPETPLDAALIVSGYSSFIRPSLTGAPVNAGTGNVVLNRNAYTAPASGQFGNARRNSITGPEQVSLNTALVRTFRLPHKLSLDAQASAANALNFTNFSSYITNINSSQFGLPAAANAQRTVQLALRLRY